jgi:hemerythrin-like metal-binding protein
MAWGPYLVTGLAEMDTQHQALADLLNQIQAAALSPEGCKEELLLKLKRCFEAHFCREEELMAQAGFPGIRRHAATHQVFLKDLEDHITEFHQGRPGSVLRWVEHLHDRFLKDIIQEDKPMAEFLAAVPLDA